MSKVNSGFTIHDKNASQSRKYLAWFIATELNLINLDVRRLMNWRPTQKPTRLALNVNFDDLNCILYIEQHPVRPVAKIGFGRQIFYAFVLIESFWQVIGYYKTYAKGVIQFKIK